MARAGRRARVRRRCSSSTSATVEPSLAGPRRPQDRVPLPAASLRDELPTARPRSPPEGADAAADPGSPARWPRSTRAAAASAVESRPTCRRSARLGRDRRHHVVHEHLQPDGHGRGRAAGPERRRPRAAVSPTVKTSLAPGLQGRHRLPRARPGCMAPLETLGFALAGYGCTTCIGNSGPLDEPVAQAIEANELDRRGGAVGQPQLRGPHPPAGAGAVPRLAAAGRRLRAGGPGRHRPHDGAARARPRRTAGDAGRHLADVRTRSATVIGRSVDPELFRATYAVVFEGDERWRALPDPVGRPLRVGRGLDLHRAAAVLRRPDRRAGAGRRTSTAPGCWRSWATR